MYYLLKILAVCIVVIGLCASCRGDEPKRMPDTIPDIEGTITSITDPQAGNSKQRVQLMVEANKTKAVAIKQASINVTDDTLIEDTDGKRLKAGQLQQGREVEVWFDGPVMESMPVQATAKAIRVKLQP
ncbi:DUF3221 domain-containing protein [Pontibacter sp. H259]|uniref:DUF3221 domain-containing protein n=1 Tax=Pontibacter sp. H259 TaxID=3133421 RepID=UPI0030C5CB23